MKKKKLMAWLLAAVLTTGLTIPVHGAESTAAIPGRSETVAETGKSFLPEDGSGIDTSPSGPENHNSVLPDGEAEDADAVPETTDGAGGSDIADEANEANNFGNADEADGAGGSGITDEAEKTADTGKADEAEETAYAGKADEAEETTAGISSKDSAKKDKLTAEGSSDTSTGSLPTDSIAQDLPKEQETMVGAAYTSAVPEDGKAYYIRCAADRNYALTVKNSSVNNKANIVISGLTKGYNQKFMCRKLSDGTYVFSNFYSGKAIRIQGDAALDSANVWQHEFNSAKSGKWKLQKNTDGSYRIASNIDSKYVFHVAGGKYADNTNVKVYSWCNSKAQKFIFTETPLPDYSGTVQLRPANAASMCASPAGVSRTAGTNIQLTEADNVKAFTYSAIRHQAGYYILSNRDNGLVLSVKNAQNKAGAGIVQEKRTNSFAQQWLLRKNADGTYTFLSRLNSTLALTPNGGGKAEGTAILLGTYKGYSSQKYHYTIKTLPSIPKAEVYIRSVMNSDRVLDVAGAGTADGTNIDCYDWNESAAQKFRLESVTYGGKTNCWYKITGTASKKVLEVAGGAANAGANIQLGTYRGAKSQIWRPALASDGTYILKSALDENYCLEMTGSESYGANVRLAKCASNAKQKWHFTSIKITKNTVGYTDRNTITVRASGSKQRSDTGLAYLFAIEPYGRTLKDAKPLASVAMSTSFIFHAKLNKDSTSSLLQKKFYIATHTNGKYTVISNGFYIQNPEASADNQKAFPTPARKTKKGIKTMADSLPLAKDLKCSHIVLDLPIDHLLDGNSLAYKYEGKTYYFNSIIDVYRDRIKSYNDAGIVVTGIFYLQNASNTAYMYPAAASGSLKGKVSLYALNTRNSNRKRLEALFACLADKWCQDGCTMANWIYGNELQQYKNYHYAGDISYSEYHEALAEEFRMFNAAIKSRWRYARTYISLDHNWNLSWNLDGTYNGKQLTADFNTDLTRQGRVHWDMAMHPYPSPEQDCRFWNRAFTVTDSGASQQITMLNARFFSSYIKSTYGNSTRVIMSETGLSSAYQGTKREAEQAASVAFAYYLAEFDPNIDMIGIHRDYDVQGETLNGWWLGLYSSPETGKTAKKSADVFRYMDTKNWSSHVSNYMNTYIGSNWKSQIPNFNENFFKDK